MRPWQRAQDAWDFAAALSLLRRWRARERWTRAELDAHRQASLRRLVHHAATRSPFYSRLYEGIDLDSVDLARLPTVDKPTVMDRFDEVVTDPRLTLPLVEAYVAGEPHRTRLLGRYRASSSSGFSGLTGYFVYDRGEWQVALATSLRWAAYRTGGRRPLRRLKQARIHRRGAGGGIGGCLSAAGNFGYYRQLFLPCDGDLRDVIEPLNRYQPDSINTYPSVAALLAREQMEGRLHIQPKRLTVVGEVLTEDMRSAIQESWGVEPTNVYGMTETAVLAMPCPEQHSLHVFDDLFIVEVVDPDNRPVPPGTPGSKMLLTTLYRHLQPLIRYEASDQLTIAPEPCPCGRPFSVIAEMNGRSDDMLYLEDEKGGRAPAHWVLFRQAMGKVPGIMEYQIVQESDGLHVLVVPSRSADRASLEAAVREHLLEVLPVSSVPLHVHFTDFIEREPMHSGKFKIVKSDVR